MISVPKFSTSSLPASSASPSFIPSRPPPPPIQKDLGLGRWSNAVQAYVASWKGYWYGGQYHNVGGYRMVMDEDEEMWRRDFPWLMRMDPCTMAKTVIFMTIALWIVVVMYQIYAATSS
ncbi:hypothetical protein BC829DRAFT_437842 [Chytridium lagenaria]|nr:hypothetical protein BC829DRAFT_437842 [Chytridium lagenaria]